MPRIVVLGTGTGVGKTYFSVRLVAALAAAQPNRDVVGIKPIETGVRRPSSGAPRRGTDAFALETVSRGTRLRPHPLVALKRGVSAHFAARNEKRRISIGALSTAMTLHGNTIRGWQIVETAGGVFSPIAARSTNFDLCVALDPAIWILVAPDALGVLHDVRAALIAMQARGRAPDYLVLSASRQRDASSGTNAAELPRVGLPAPITVLARARDSAAALAPLVRALARRSRH